MVGGSSAPAFPQFPVLNESFFLHSVEGFIEAKLELCDVLFLIACNVSKLFNPEVGCASEVREIPIDVLAGVRKTIKFLRQHCELLLEEVGDENKPAYIPEAENIGTPDSALRVDTFSG